MPKVMTILIHTHLRLLLQPGMSIIASISTTACRRSALYALPRCRDARRLAEEAEMIMLSNSSLQAPLVITWCSIRLTTPGMAAERSGGAFVMISQ